MMQSKSGGSVFVSPARGPVEDGVFVLQAVGYPQVPLGGFAASSGEILNGCFIELDITAGELFVVHLLCNRPQPVGDELDAPAEGVASEVDAVALLEDLFLTVERQVIGIFADDHMRQQPRSHHAAFK